MAIQAQLFSENLGFNLGNSQDLSVESGLVFDNLCFASQPQQQLVQTQLDQFQNTSDPKNLNNVRFDQQFESMTFSGSVSAYMDRERLEFEQFVNLQNERLRIAMQEQRKHQMTVLMKKFELKAELLLRQKEEEIARAANQNKELQNFLRRIEIDNQTWQRRAKENEAMIVSLNSSIHQLQESAHLSENAAEDAESCCQNIQENPKINTPILFCRCCNSRNSCVVMLPCRHLCSCKNCDVFLDSCPVCGVGKKGTVEALI